MAQGYSQSEEVKDEKRKVTRQGLQKVLKVYRFILPYRSYFAIGMIFLVFSTLTALVVPFLAGSFLDVALGNETWFFSSIQQVMLVFAAILILQSLFSFFRIYLFALVSERAMADIRGTLYKRIITLPLGFLEQRRVGELNSRITADVTQLQDALSFTIAEFFRQIATILIGTTILFLQSTRLTLFMIATFPILVIMAIIFGRFIRKVAKQAQDELAASNIIVEETLQSIQAVKAFTNEWLEVRRYRNSLKKVVGMSIKVAAYRGAFASFVITVLIGGVMLVLAYGASLVESGDLQPGTLTSFIIYTAFIGGSMGGMSELYGQLQKASGASERVLEIIEEEAEISDEAIQNESKYELPPLKGKIVLDKVHFSYPSRADVEVLKGISLEVEQGKKVALVGYSGAGKSTITQLLGRYYPLNDGEIRIDGQKIQDYPLTYLRNNIGVVPQEVILFGGTIRENIAYGRPEAEKEEIILAARQANAWGFIDSFPDGLNTVVGERGIKLSGGQRQRIAIARAILKNPSILILDEATSSLDADSEKLVQEALETLMENRTTVVIAHRLATIRKVDTIFVIQDGKIAESGTHEELKELPQGIYQNLVKLQFASEVPEVS